VHCHRNFHLKRKDDGLTNRAPVLERYPDFAALIRAGEDEALSEKLRRAETIGRPLGNDAFLGKLERKYGRPLKPAKRGPKVEEEES
jgi:putative transposase